MMRAGRPPPAPGAGTTLQPAPASSSASARSNAPQRTAALAFAPLTFFFMWFDGVRVRAVRTVTAAALAAAAAPQVVAGREDDVSALAVEVFALDGRRVFQAFHDSRFTPCARVMFVSVRRGGAEFAEGVQRLGEV